MNMKNTIKYLMLAFFGMLGLASCVKEMEYTNDGTVPVQELLVPAADAEMVLINSADATSLFEWTLGTTKTTQKYYVVFYDKADGGKELYRFNNNKPSCEALISHDLLSSVAAKAGIAPSQKGDIWWNVISYNGNNEQKSDVASNKLTVVRYDGIDDVPSSLYMGGISDVAEGMTVRQMAANGNVFDIYARLSANDKYYFTNRGDGNVARRFYIAEGENGATLLEGDAESVSLDGVYHIQLDLGRSAAKMEKIEGVALHWCWTPDYNANALQYDGLGVWSLKNYTIPTGDNRYRFRALVDGVEYIWGAPASNDAEPSTLDGSYFDIVFTEKGNISQWDYKFKFMGVTKGQSCDVYLKLGERNHHVLDFGNITPNPVTAVSTPAAIASSSEGSPVDLSSINGELRFSWTVEPGDYKISPKYRVIFSHNGAAVETIETENTFITIEAGHLDNMLDKVGIAAGKSATLSWKVEAYILNNTAAQTCDAESFTVSRISLPTALYLTGAATEFGTNLANAGKMNIVGKEGSGQFTLYSKINAGQYRFATSKGSDARYYVLDGGKLVSGNGNITNSKEAVYRITVNIATKELKLEEITDIQIRNEGNGGWTYKFTYTGNGIWESKSMGMNRIGWWGERYYFSAFADGVEELWGYSRQNNDQPEVFHTDAADPTHEDDPPQYIYIQKRGNISRWDYTFKDGRGGGLEHNFNEVYLHLNGNAEHNHPFYKIRCTWGEYYPGDRNTPLETEFVYIANQL